MPRLVPAIAAILVGMFALFLAHDIHSWQTSIGSAALRSVVSPTNPPRVTPGTVLPSGVSGSLLATGRDRRWLLARQRFDLAYARTVHKTKLNQDDYRALNGAEALLSKLTQDPNPVRSSRAYNLLAALVFREAYPGTIVVRRLVQESLTDEQNAVRLDATDEDAKENLELTLRVLIAVGLPPQQARAEGTKRANAKKGGFQGPPGAGY